MASNKNTEIQEPPCCVFDTEKYVFVAGGIQIILAILWLLYSIISWLAEPFPRVKNEFEAYYAFGQPMVSGILGVGLIISTVTWTELFPKFVYGGCWMSMQFALACITIFRIATFFIDDLYIDTFRNYQDYLMAECFMCGSGMIFQLYETIAVICYLFDQSRIAAEDEDDDISEVASLTVQIFLPTQWNAEVIQQKQLIMISRPILAQPAIVPVLNRHIMYSCPYPNQSPHDNQEPNYYNHEGTEMLPFD